MKPFIHLSLILLLAFSINAPAQIPPPSGVGLTQKLDAQIPPDLPFRDSTGKNVKIGEYFGSRPVLLVMAYYECPALCTLVLNSVLTSAQDLRFDTGKEYEIVVVSFDPRETPALAAEKKKNYTRRYGRPQATDGWHFLTGQKTSIEKLAHSIGFEYRYDPKTDQYAHPSAITILTPAGKVSQYFAGIEYPPHDLRLAIITASKSRIGSLTDQIFLLCFHYNPLTGKYGLLIMRVLTFACLLTVGALGFFMVVHFRRDHLKSMEN